jgi:hypothetical protein
MGLVGVGAVAAAQQDGDTPAAAPVVVTAEGPALDVAPAQTTPAAEAAAVDSGPDVTPTVPAAVVPGSDAGGDGVDELADVATAAATTGELTVTYRSDVGGSITSVVLAEGGAVASSAILESAVAHRFELPAGTYVVDVMQESGLVTQGDVATSSASTVRSAPVVVTEGGQVELHCTFSGCEVR